MSSAAEAARQNQMLGTWPILSAQIDPEGEKRPAYDPPPNGLLSFTPDMHYVEVLANADVPRFASEERGQGDDAENRAAMAGGIGFFGTYTVDANSEFTGNDVQGCTLPKWSRNVGTRQRLQIAVDGDSKAKTFRRPGGVRIVIHWRVFADRSDHEDCHASRRS